MLARSKARVLRALRKVDKFLTAERWGRHAPGLDMLGREVDPLDDEAKRFCLQGSLIRLAPGLEGPAFRMVMRYLHNAAAEMSNGRFTSVFEMNDHPDVEFIHIKQVLAHAISAIENDALSLGEAEHREARDREACLQDPHDAWVHARIYGERHMLTGRTLALALCHAGRMGFARISKDGAEARDANTLLASRLFVHLTLQIMGEEQRAEIIPIMPMLSRNLPDGWYERIVKAVGNDQLMPTPPAQAGNIHDTALAVQP